ncbi:MAG: hypothetical protein Q8J88_10035 [Bacteroidales bacterium]|nr:hypothetical protein [Bacteroidales bacterium]
MADKLTFGILVNGPIIEKWQAEVITLLLNEGHKLTLIVQNDNPQIKQSFIKRLQNYPWNRFVFRVWHRFLFKPLSKQPFDISSLYGETKVLYCQTIQNGIKQLFDTKDVQFIKQNQLDFLLRFGFNIIRGDILNAARYGVWSFHHDDEMVVRGGPPGFWEIYHKMVSNGVILQQLTDSLDKGILLKKIHFPVIRHSYKAHLDSIYGNSAFLPVHICSAIMHGNFESTPSVSEATVFHPPGNLRMLFFFIKMAYRRVSFHLNDLFRQEDWNIGIIKTSVSNVISEPENYLKQTYWFPKKNNSSYLADPFIIDFKDETLLFAEQFDYRKGKGQLVLAKASESFSTFKAVTSEKLHLSFPFLFKWEEKLYCLPECFESDGVQLYHYDEVSGKLVHEKCILDGHRAVDPVLFEHESRWWLMFSTKDLPSVNLYAFYSQNPFGPFKAHRQNPVKTNISSARNAGNPLIYNKMLIRPSQDCAGHYGKAITLNKIIELTPDTFKEVVLKKIQPDKNTTFRYGIHTLNGNTENTVIDGKRYVFTFAGFRHQLKQKLKKR